MIKYENALKELKKLDLAQRQASLWLVKRHLRAHIAVYKIVRVEIDTKLKQRLNSIVKKQIQDNNRITEYTFEPQENDDGLFAHTAADTDFIKMREAIEGGTDVETATKVEDLVDIWGYVIKIHSVPDPVYAFKKVSESWTAKKVLEVANVLFRDHMLVDLSDKQVFKIDKKVDFLCFRDLLFILDKKEFEHGLNFRVGMIRNRDAILDEFKELGLFSDVAPILATVGDNLPLLKKLSTIKRNGFYKDANFIQRLKEQIQAEGGDLQIANNKFVVNEKNVTVILVLLNDDRLRSPITEAIYNVTGKRKVQ